MVWKPNVTVAAVVERDGRFLVVEEHTDLGVRYNQPAGHLEPGESLQAASARETLEETAYPFEPQALLGVYLWPRPDGAVTYLRVAFTGTVGAPDPHRALDQGIVAAHWLTRDELAALGDQLRSPLVLQCVDDYLAGIRYPLTVLTYYPYPS